MSKTDRLFAATSGRHIRGLIGLLVVLGSWHAMVPDGIALIPTLTEVVTTFLQFTISGTLPSDTISSVIRVMTGVLISTVFATALGLISVYWKSFPDYLAGCVELVRPIPPIAWTPLAIIAFGIGTRPAVAIVALGAFFPVWLGIQQGLKEVNPSHVRAAGSLGCGQWMLLTDVIVPSILPYAFHGLRLAVGLGWFCVVAAEMMGASSGLGYGIQLFSLNLEMSKMYCYLLTIGALGYLSNALLQNIDSRLNRWRDHD